MGVPSTYRINGCAAHMRTYVANAPTQRREHPLRWGMAHYSRIKDWSETHNGVLKKRGDLFREAEAITERLAEIKNDIKAIDKTLRVAGCTYA